MPFALRVSVRMRNEKIDPLGLVRMQKMNKIETDAVWQCHLDKFTATWVFGAYFFSPLSKIHRVFPLRNESERGVRIAVLHQR